MSFSSDVKQELGKVNNLANKEFVKCEMIGYLLSCNTQVVNSNQIKFSTESDYNINRFSKLLANLDIDHNIDVVGKWFVITLKIKDISLVTVKENNIYHIQRKQDEESKKAIIRGLFMGSGSINNPKNKYHLEISLSNKENLEYAKSLIAEFGIKIKELITYEKYAVYIKEGEEISKTLALIGANKAVMQFEDIRIEREMRGKVNRIVNCKGANLNKTINASIEQIEAIEKLKKEKRFNKLDDNLKEIAILRLENPDMSLVELGKMLRNPIGKSGVNYRLKKIIDIANL